MAKPIHLQGTTLEGGGQLLRLATCLSALTSTPITITDIRGKRSGGGGLKAQHLTSVQWLGAASNARLSGVGLKSKEITFAPGKGGISRLEWRNGGDVSIKQNTPGSVNLVLQAVLPFMLFANIGSNEGEEIKKVRVKITGGTNVSNSPSCDYVEQVLMPMFSLIGIPPIETQIHARGWSQGSSGLGSMTYTIKPLRKPLPAFQLVERGEIKSVRATIIAPRDAEAHFRDELDVVFAQREANIFGAREPEIEVSFEDSKHEKRYYLLLVATTTTGIKLGRDWLYDRGVRAGKTDAVISSIVRKVSSDLIEEIEQGACVDEHMRDQLVVFQALAVGKSSVYGGKRKAALVEPSLHAKTAHWVAKEVIDVAFDDEGGCKGIGFGAGQTGDEGHADELSTDKALARDLEKLRVAGN
ncbi:RNA 3'-terminal phosphate cyclase [Bimuria novae-zelandiae CBS 107.79]|uniref:RNA 3'-terminal phosphate cyclase n=1 Tax=Bimuria novae-zelandiae CBS 107.79 TaxID=1447943 RepID=A0A6A5V170_9PLEO|nr:RNA 3'-terminal phosphate cyclase [Bimuria novae-zelandiae CBS 107.79]